MKDALTKEEIALLYYPRLASATARRKFNDELANTPVLLEKLTRLGYTRFTKMLTPRQVEAITMHLGEP